MAKKIKEKLSNPLRLNFKSVQKTKLSVSMRLYSTNCNKNDNGKIDHIKKK